MKMIIEDDDCDECIHEKSFINNLEETKNEARMAGAYQRPIISRILTDSMNGTMRIPACVN